MNSIKKKRIQRLSLKRLQNRQTQAARTKEVKGIDITGFRSVPCVRCGLLTSMALERARAPYLCSDCCSERKALAEWRVRFNYQGAIAKLTADAFQIESHGTNSKPPL